MTEFTDFPLAKSILRAIAEEGYTTPTPIQEKSIPPLMEGHDLLGVAQTGTGYVMNACRHAGLLTHFITEVISRGMHVQVSAIEQFEGEDLAECQGGHLHRDLPEHIEQWWCESAIKLAKFDECIIINGVSSITYDAVAMEALITTLEGRFVLLKLSHAT